MKTILRNSLLCLVCILFAGCSDNTVYLKSVNVHLSQWALTDSLFFPIQVEDEASIIAPLETNVDYRLFMSVRFAHNYCFRQLPLRCLLEKADSTGIFKLQKDLHIELPVVDQDGLPDGASWGSLRIKDFQVTRTGINLPEVGNYRLVLLPDTLIEGIASVTVSLEK